MSIKNALLRFGQKQIERDRLRFLAPIAWIWGGVVWIKNWGYDRGWFRVHRVSCPVVSVGNLVAGGTGKTPLVALLARVFFQKRIAILSRGYGEIADEALLLQQKFPQATVYIGKDRVQLAQRAVKEGADLIFLDDGFQYRRLHRDFDLVLLDAEDPYGGFFLPRGFLRDSPRRLTQASALFLKQPHPQVPEAVVLRAMPYVPALEQARRVGVFCGIAKPGPFLTSVRSLGFHVVEEWILADHEKPSAKALDCFASRCKALGAKILLCTEKDAIKQNSLYVQGLLIQPIPYELEPAEGLQVWENLIEKIQQAIDNRPCYE